MLNYDKNYITMDFKKAKYYDKISKEQISFAIVKKRIKVGLNNTFYIIFNSEDKIEELKKFIKNDKK
jgi:hypothetical protein